MALTVSRRPGEHIFIGKDICVTLVECAGRKATIRVSAPRGVSILRDDVLEHAEVQSRLVALEGKGDRTNDNIS